MAELRHGVFQDLLNFLQGLAYEIDSPVKLRRSAMFHNHAGSRDTHGYMGHSNGSLVEATSPSSAFGTRLAFTDCG